MDKVKSVKVDLGSRSYEISIGAGLFRRAETLLAPHLGKKLCIVTDENVAPLYLDAFKDSIAGLGLVIETIILPPGEAQKNFENLQMILARLLAANFSRNDTILALGGGVVGDLSGFAASILKRGCGFIQVPTTLLAQVDSSVGGKTAINTPAGKNLVGSFYQPKLVLIDTDVLSTLPARQLKAGYAEVVKYGLINNSRFWHWLQANGADVLALNPDAIAMAVATSCEAKASIVAQDERETGARALLNLGHTFGHALEGAGQYDGRLLHGEAVSAGMLMAHEYSLGSDDKDTQAVADHLAQMGMVTWDDIPDELTNDRNALVDFMKKDKKNAGDQLTLVLTNGIGQAYIDKNCDLEQVRAYMRSK